MVHSGFTKQERDKMTTSSPPCVLCSWRMRETYNCGPNMFTVCSLMLCTQHTISTNLLKQPQFYNIVETLWPNSFVYCPNNKLLFSYGFYLGIFRSHPPYASWYVLHRTWTHSFLYRETKNLVSCWNNPLLKRGFDVINTTGIFHLLRTLVSSPVKM